MGLGLGGTCYNAVSKNMGWHSNVRKLNKTTMPQREKQGTETRRVCWLPSVLTSRVAKLSWLPVKYKCGHSSIMKGSLSVKGWHGSVSGAVGQTCLCMRLFSMIFKTSSSSLYLQHRITITDFVSKTKANIAAFL